MKSERRRLQHLAAKYGNIGVISSKPIEGVQVFLD